MVLIVRVPWPCLSLTLNNLILVLLKVVFTAVN